MMMKIKIVIVVVIMASFLACNRNIEYASKQIEGIFYTVYEIEGNTVFSFISLKNGQYINRHGLYLDLNRENMFREPYQPEIFDYSLRENQLFIEDTTNSYEVEELSLTRSKVKLSLPRFKIKKNRNGVILLENTDIQLTYTKLVE